MSVNKDYNALGEQVLKTLLYFDIFSYPLKTGEVYTFLRTVPRGPVEVRECLEALAEKKHVFRFGELYSLHPNEINITRRIKGNLAAEEWLTVAKKKARFIATFPFVRAVMASGSLSKGYMDEKSDLDFFIVTAPGRLWIARTLLVLYKRLFLFNSHKCFCVNYFVDQHHLEIEEKNLFTATELATLIPLYNYEAYEEVLMSNSWVNEYFPNYRPRPRGAGSERVLSLFGKVIEYMLLPVAPWLDKVFMKISRKRWKSLYARQYAREDFEIAFKSRRHVSKNHPNHYQKKILDLYQRKLVEFRHRFTELTPYD